QILSSHLTTLTSFGQINAFSTFQSYYSTTLLPSYPTSSIAWIGTLQILSIYSLGFISGRLADSGHLRLTLFTGFVLQAAGLFAASAATRYWQLLLAQGVCCGVGMGLGFTPGVANAAGWFGRGTGRERWRVVAVSSVACGGATGALVFAGMAERLLDRVGFAWTMRAMGLVVVVCGAVVVGLVRKAPRMETQVEKEGEERAPWIEWRAWREPVFAGFCVSMWFAFWGVWIAYYYVRPFSLTILHVSPNTSFTYLLVLNAIGIPGRLVPALLADRLLGPLTTFIPVLLCAGISLFAWAAVRTPDGMLAFVLVYGFFGAGTQALLQAALASLCPEPRRAGARMGLGFGVVGLASLTGSPVGGALIQVAGGRYVGAQCFAGAAMLLG
ncbi:uncharacterized protein K452DRAFT_207309, partial [Aplosporella prunicola CBS 121167]